MAFHAKRDGSIYFHVQRILRKLKGRLLQPHVSPFIPPYYSILSQYIPFNEVRRNKKKYICVLFFLNSSNYVLFNYQSELQKTKQKQKNKQTNKQKQQQQQQNRKRSHYSSLLLFPEYK